MNLNEAIRQIAADFNLDANKLAAYADEDPHKGWDLDKGGWLVGSIWGVEGKVLYALVRYARPFKALEIGTAHGCSATHIAQALKDNGHGKLTCLDKGIDAGSRIPADLRNFWTLKAEDEHLALAKEMPGVDFIFEDGEHSSVAVEKVVRMAMQKLTPGGWLISHDALHFLAGDAIMQGWRNAGVEPKTYLIEPADCGLAIWRKPGTPPKPEPEAVPQVEVAPAPVKRRKSRTPKVEDKKAYG